MGGRIVATVAFSIRRISKKDAREGSRCKFVGGGGGDVGVAKATEYAKVIVGRWMAIEEMVGSEVTTGTAWAHVEKTRGGGESFGPEARRHGGVEEQSAYAVIEGAEHALGAAVLLRRVGTRESKNGAVCGEQRVYAVVIKLTPVIRLKPKDHMTKLRVNKCEERGEHGEHVRLTAKREGPNEMREIIEQHQIILKTRIAYYGRCPYITVE